MDDLSLLLLALSLISVSLLLRDLMNFAPLNEQVDASLKVMADAVAQLQSDFNALAVPNNDQATVDAIIARLKAGTDQLANAIATVQKAR
jgi:hypothetical protein